MEEGGGELAEREDLDEKMGSARRRQSHRIRKAVPMLIDWAVAVPISVAPAAAEALRGRVDSRPAPVHSQSAQPSLRQRVAI